MDTSDIIRYENGHRPYKCTCLTTPKLTQTGLSDPEWKCPVCDQLYGEKRYDDLDEEEFYWPA